MNLCICCELYIFSFKNLNEKNKSVNQEVIDCGKNKRTFAAMRAVIKLSGVIIVEQESEHLIRTQSTKQPNVMFCLLRTPSVCMLT